MAVATKSISIEIEQTSDVAVTAIAHDDVAGDYFRDIRIFATAGEPALSLRIRAATVEALQIAVPESEF